MNHPANHPVNNPANNPASHIDGLIALSRRSLESALALAAREAPRVLAVDCTAGNGHDTLFLAERCGPSGHVWAFDVQRAALDRTAARLAAAGLTERVTLVARGHEHLAASLPPEAAGNIAAAAFNLGFLPGSGREIVTRAETTLAALAALTLYLAPQGLLSVHVYTGHPGGREEGDAVAAWFSALPWEEWRAASYTLANRRANREILFLAERRKSPGCG